MHKYLIQIPSYKEWQAKASVRKDDWQSYQSFFARVGQTLCMLDIIWPNFVEHEGLILRESNIPTNWDHFKLQAKEMGWSPSDMEYVINHIHIFDLFINDPDRDNIGIAVYDFLSNTIATTWEARLKSDYPNYNFTVGVSNNEEPEVYAFVDRPTVKGSMPKAVCK